MTKEQLNQFKEFPDWYGNEEYREKVDKLNDSRDVYCLYTAGMTGPKSHASIDSLKHGEFVCIRK